MTEVLYSHHECDEQKATQSTIHQDKDSNKISCRYICGQLQMCSFFNEFRINKCLNSKAQYVYKEILNASGCGTRRKA